MSIPEWKPAEDCLGWLALAWREAHEWKNFHCCLSHRPKEQEPTCPESGKVFVLRKPSNWMLCHCWQKLIDLYDLLVSLGIKCLISMGPSFSGLAIWLEKSLKSKSKTWLNKDKAQTKQQSNRSPYQNTNQKPTVHQPPFYCSPLLPVI